MDKSKFVFGAAYVAALKENISGSKRSRMAVAFWGDGAISELGLGHRRNIEVLCNLTMGGTNPKVVRELQKTKGIVVKHSPSLHAKVFLFDDRAIVGSANASCNGLGFEGHEVDAWDEAGVIVDDEKTLDAIRLWMDKSFGSAADVGEEDLKAAEEKWKRRRAKRSLGDAKSKTLLGLIKASPFAIKDREIYLVCDTEKVGPAGEKAESKAIHRYGDDFEIWEDWADIPRDAVFVSFFWDRKQISFEGIYRSDSNWPDMIEDGVSCQVVQCHDELDIPELSLRLSSRAIGPKKDWHSILERIRDDNLRKWKRDNGCSLRIDHLERFV